MTDYDSTIDTQEHIAAVNEGINDVVDELLKRGREHDASKLEEPEKSMFDRFTPLLSKHKYGSDEYKATTAAMKEDGGLQHHYAHNRHHPEFHENGISDMNLLDIIEMLADWKASVARSPDGSLARSIRMNAARFNYGHEMMVLLENTARDLGWI